MTSLYLAIVVVSLAAVLVLETLTPLHSTANPPLRRWLRNMSLSALAIAALLAAPPVLKWVMLHLGISPSLHGLQTWGWPVWLQWVATFAVLDGALYALHRLSHRVPWLWRLHAVHHSDTELDATTTHRHHPLESLVSVLWTLPLLWLLAPPMGAVLSYGLLAVLVSTWSHGNLRLPAWLDRLLRNVIVTPGFHRVHHSAHQPQTDSHYGTVFTLYDQLFRTASAPLADAGQSLTIGLETERGAQDQSVARLLHVPFASQKPAHRTRAV